jgi:hypothetical protein
MLAEKLLRDQASRYVDSLEAEDVTKLIKHWQCAYHLANTACSSCGLTK